MKQAKFFRAGVFFVCIFQTVNVWCDEPGQQLFKLLNPSNNIVFDFASTFYSQPYAESDMEVVKANDFFWTLDTDQKIRSSFIGSFVDIMEKKIGSWDLDVDEKPEGVPSYLVRFTLKDYAVLYRPSEIIGTGLWMYFITYDIEIFQSAGVLDSGFIAGGGYVILGEDAFIQSSANALPGQLVYHETIQYTESIPTEGSSLVSTSWKSNTYEIYRRNLERDGLNFADIFGLALSDLFFSKLKIRRGNNLLAYTYTDAYTPDGVRHLSLEPNMNHLGYSFISFNTSSDLPVSGSFVGLEWRTLIDGKLVCRLEYASSNVLYLTGPEYDYTHELSDGSIREGTYTNWRTAEPIDMVMLSLETPVLSWNLFNQSEDMNIGLWFNVNAGIGTGFFLGSVTANPSVLSWENLLECSASPITTSPFYLDGRVTVDMICNFFGVLFNFSNGLAYGGFINYPISTKPALQYLVSMSIGFFLPD